MSKAEEIAANNNAAGQLNDTVKVPHPDGGHVVFSRMTERQKDVLHMYNALNRKKERKAKS